LFANKPTNHSGQNQDLVFPAIPQWQKSNRHEALILRQTTPPPQQAEVVEKLKVYEDDLSIFEAGSAAVGE
jgi:hypothetical protein